MKLLRLLAAITSLAIAAGCETTHYEFKAPASEQGRLCTVHCAGIQETCRGNDSARVQNEKAMCEHSNDIAMRSCLSKAGNKDQEKDCYNKRRSCYVSDQLERCEANYRQCFVGCGGSIREYKTPLFQ
jgi:hypothetical protein